MRLTCPECGAASSAAAWENDANSRQAHSVIVSMPSEVCRRCFSYLALFRPHGGRGLSWARVLRLAAELKELTETSHIQWEGKPARLCTASAWAQAMERMIQVPPKRLPLKNHNYLRAIAYEIADEADKRVEQRHRAAEAAGNVRRPEGATPGPERISFDELKRIADENYRRKSRNDKP